MKQIVIED